jgi:hypothetical protein
VIKVVAKIAKGIVLIFFIFFSLVPGRVGAADE